MAIVVKSIDQPSRVLMTVAAPDSRLMLGSSATLVAGPSFVHSPGLSVNS